MPHPKRGYYIEVDGETVEVPGVTSIIGQLGWGSGGLKYYGYDLGKSGMDIHMANRLTLDVGTAVHATVDHEVSGAAYDGPKIEDPSFRQQAMNCIIAWRKFQEDWGPKHVSSEVQLTSDEYMYGGTYDQLWDVDGSIDLCDIKTAKKVKKKNPYPQVLVQLSAYEHLLRLSGEDRVDGLSVLRLDKLTGEYDYRRWCTNKHRDKIDEAWEAFKLCRQLYDREPLVGKYVGKRSCIILDKER